jgi:Cu/Ag efflux protein CusF
MKIAKSVLAAAAVLTFFSTGALAAGQQVEGMIVKLDKANHQITIQRGAPGQTVGGGIARPEQFTLNHDPSFDVLKVGDQVTLKVEELNGVLQVTHFDK